jgi:hypothetical protein
VNHRIYPKSTSFLALHGASAAARANAGVSARRRVRFRRRILARRA